jgi:hypothetical protein
MGSQTAKADRNRGRAQTTEQLMQNIMTGGEISKRREAELEKAAAAGRGIQFLPGSPTVKGLTQKGGQPVYRTGVTAQDFTGRFTASPPTLREVFGDVKRALVGGQAKAQPYIYSPTTKPGTPTTTFRQFTPQPRQERGIIPALAEKVLVPGGITLGIAKDLFQKVFPGQEEDDTQPIVDLRKPVIEERVSSFVDVVDQGDEKRETLKTLIAQSQAPGASELNVDTMSDAEVDLRLQSYGQGFAMGGLTDTIPPERGPMSQGVASLFKNK